MPKTTRHKISGVIDKNTPDHILNHPVFGQYLEVVEDNAKPFVPELHNPDAKIEADAKVKQNPKADD